MKAFTQIALFLAAATSVVADNIITFESLDDVDRTVYFTPNAGYPEVDSVDVAGGDKVPVEIPEGWIGNWIAVKDGSEKKDGMLGEIAFQGWNGLTYFDVSAIVNPNDMDNVREMYPEDDTTNTSGCKVFPCNNAYYVWDDVQTKTTPATKLICTLGANGLSGLSKREEHPVVGRDYVLGKF